MSECHDPQALSVKLLCEGSALCGRRTVAGPYPAENREVALCLYNPRPFNYPVKLYLPGAYNILGVNTTSNISCHSVHTG